MKENTFSVLIINFSLLILLAVVGCKSYTVASNGYIVHGDYNYVSVEESISITLGQDLLSPSIWKMASVPLHPSTPSKQHNRILNRIGYNTTDYKVIFSSVKGLPFGMVALMNSIPMTSEKASKLVDFGKLMRKESKYAKWYQEIFLAGKNLVYHAIIPVSEKLFDEKYLSLIYFAQPDQINIPLLEKIVQENAERFRISTLRFFPMKLVDDCKGKGVIKYFDYAIPDAVKQTADYALIKAYKDKQKSELVFYTLLHPKQVLGAFRLCEGKYYIEFTTLEGTNLWNDEVEVN